VTPEFAAYKDQLRQVALPLRVGGLLVILVGCALLVCVRGLNQPSLMPLGLAMLGLGWGLTGYTVWLRTQWAKQNPYMGPR
jgi:hypothetical protein